MISAVVVARFSATAWVSGATIVTTGGYIVWHAASSIICVIHSTGFRFVSGDFSLLARR